MKDIEFHILIDRNSVNTMIIDVYALKDATLYQLNFDTVVDDNLVKWFVEIDYRRGVRITDKSSLLVQYYLNRDSHPIAPPPSQLFEKTSLVPGHYHPRIFRPQLVINKDSYIGTPYQYVGQLAAELKNIRNYLPFDELTALTGVTQLSLLVENLKTICKTVYPITDNLTVYGNEIRNQLILACTELEAQLTGIFNANSMQSSEQRLTTKEFVRLLPILKLDSYSVLFNLYPWLDNFRPFSNWNSTHPTKSISWYDDYNAVKHDREKNFRRAALGSLLSAIAALAILLIAQYGDRITFWPDLIGKFFRFGERPTWSLDERFLPPFKGKNWTKIPAL